MLGYLINDCFQLILNYLIRFQSILISHRDKKKKKNVAPLSAGQVDDAAAVTSMVHIIMKI